MRKFFFVLLLITVVCNAGMAQHTDTSAHKFFTKKNIVKSAIIYQQVTGVLVEYAWWWIDSLQPMHFKPDQFWQNYSLGMDKFGHFYTSYFTFTAVNEAMRWAEFTTRQRLLTATILPAVWAISIEVGDGLSPYGFSVPDLVSNLTGIGYGFLQEQIPYLQNFTPKFSFWPTRVYTQAFPKYWAPTSDYNAHTYWLSMNIHNILPHRIGRYWPELLNIAVGYSIKDHYMSTQGRELMIGIDLNIRAIKTKSTGLTAFRNVINLFHLPSPGVKISKGFAPDYQLLLKN